MVLVKEKITSLILISEQREMSKFSVQAFACNKSNAISIERNPHESSQVQTKHFNWKRSGNDSIQQKSTI